MCCYFTRGLFPVCTGRSGSRGFGFRDLCSRVTLSVRPIDLLNRTTPTRCCCAVQSQLPSRGSKCKSISQTASSSFMCSTCACVCVCLPHQHAHTHTRIYHYNLGRISRARWGTGRILRGWREGPNFSEPWSAELCKARNAVNSTFGVTSRGPGLNQ